MARGNKVSDTQDGEGDSSRYPPLRYVVITEIFSVLRKLIFCVTTVVCVYMIFGTVRDIGLARPEALPALADVVKGFGLDRILLGIWGTISTFGWIITQKGKKRAIKKKGELEKILHQGDVGWTSSGLNP